MCGLRRHDGCDVNSLWVKGNSNSNRQWRPPSSSQFLNFPLGFGDSKCKILLIMHPTLLGTCRSLSAFIILDASIVVALVSTANIKAGVRFSQLWQQVACMWPGCRWPLSHRTHYTYCGWTSSPIFTFIALQSRIIVTAQKRYEDFIKTYLSYNLLPVHLPNFCSWRRYRLDFLKYSVLEWTFSFRIVIFS